MPEMTLTAIIPVFGILKTSALTVYATNPAGIEYASENILPENTAMNTHFKSIIRIAYGYPSVSNATISTMFAKPTLA